MGRLERLRKPIQNMTSDELRELVRDIRADRRLTKEKPSVKRTVARKKDKDNTDLKKLLEGMTPEEIEAILGTEQ